MTKIISYSFRWPLKQVEPNVIEVGVPIGDGPPILNPAFCATQKLSDGEKDKAEFEVLRSIAIIQ